MSQLTCRNAGISLPFETIRLVDQARGDVPRSTFVLRAIEHVLAETGKKEAWSASQMK